VRPNRFGEPAALSLITAWPCGVLGVGGKAPVCFGEQVIFGVICSM